jgi:V8-like Glu-specific endopeptidase
MKASKSIMLILISLLFVASAAFADGPLDYWMSTTMLVQNEWGGKGTGFLVSRKVDDNNIKIFLVTNKHVLNENEVLRKKASRIIVFLNERDESNRIAMQAYEIKFDDKNDWKEHPDKNVDVLAIDITTLFKNNKNIMHRTANYDVFANSWKAGQPIYISVGDDVLVIGYPLGHTQTGERLRIESTEGSALPIVRQGILSTPISSRIDNLPAFMIDGAVIPGSSGSPVIIKPRYGFLRGNEWIMGSVPAALLGIVSGTKLSKDSKLSNLVWQSNMGIVFNTDTIKDTIELFFN